MIKNFAVIGVGGYVAPRHLKAIRDTGNRLVAAVDPKDSVGILDQFSFDVRFFTEIERFDRHLEKLRRGPEEGRIHFVSICSPNYLHDAHCRLAMRVGADLIRFARVDFNNKTIRLIAVPRDLWVETPHLDYLNLDQSRLGLVYYRVEQNTIGTDKEIATASTSAVAQALYDNYAVAADHYIFFEMRYFADAIDQLGGLDVNIPADISFGDYSFHAGEQHLDGQHALLYTRLLPGNELSDGWNRVDRQNLILKVLIAKLLDPANIVKIPGLIQEFNADITTDLSLELITNLACLADKVPQDQITNVRVDQNMIIGAGPDSSMIADTEMVKQFLQEQLAP